MSTSALRGRQTGFYGFTAADVELADLLERLWGRAQIEVGVEALRGDQVRCAELLTHEGERVFIFVVQERTLIGRQEPKHSIDVA